MDYEAEYRRVNALYDRCANDYIELRRAAMALYFAGEWKAPDVPRGDDLWKALREALAIPSGTSSLVMQARRQPVTG